MDGCAGHKMQTEMLLINSASKRWGHPIWLVSQSRWERELVEVVWKGSVTCKRWEGGNGREVLPNWVPSSRCAPVIESQQHANASCVEWTL